MNTLLTMKQLCEQLQVSKPTVYRMIGKGLPVVRIGSAVRFKPEDIDAWIAKQPEQTGETQ